MPISSGFSFYQTNYPSPKRIIRPQIVSRAPKFQENQRKKNWNGLFSKPKATAGGKLPPAQRPTTVVKQTLRSDTFTLPTKRDEINFKVPKVNQAQNGSRRPPTNNKPAVVNSLPPAEPKRILPMRKTVNTHSSVKQVNSNMNLERKPVRFANNYNNTYYTSSPVVPPPAYYPRTAPLADPLPQDHFDKSRHMHRTRDDYVIHRRKDSPAYAYTDYQTVSNNIPTTSYMTSLPSISQSTNPTAPTVIIHPKETLPSNPPTVIIHSKENKYSRSPTVIPTLSTMPSYPSSAPFMILPQSTAPTSTMFLPNSTLPSYPPTSTMFLPTTTAPNQPPVHTFLFQPSPTSTYLSQPFFYPMPFPKPNPPLAPPPPPPAAPPPQQTIISQSSSSSVSAPTTIKTENKTEENNATIVVHPNSTNNNMKNVTIQLKMLNEDQPPQRVVRVVRDSPYRERDDVYYIESEPQRIIYEQPRRRTAVIRQPPLSEYVYTDEFRRPPHRSEVVYIDNDRPLAYQDEIVYVDDHNNEIEYIYDDDPRYHRRSSKNSRQSLSSTNIVYQ